MGIEGLCTKNIFCWKLCEMCRSAQKNHFYSHPVSILYPLLLGGRVRKVIFCANPLSFANAQGDLQSSYTEGALHIKWGLNKAPIQRGLGKVSQSLVHTCTFQPPSFWYGQGIVGGVQIPKHFFAKNCMKCPDLHRKNVCSSYHYDSRISVPQIFWLGIASKVQICIQKLCV